MTNEKLEQRREDLMKWFRSLPPPFNCQKCGGFHPATLEFHFPEQKKDYSVLDAIKRGYTINKVQKDMEKSKILCSNCHNKLHWKEKYGF